jgi:hypothetical protein
MKNQLIRNLSVALLAAAASISVQGSQILTVQVPFGFHVGSSTLPSGEYTVDTDAAQGVVRLRSADSKSTVMIQSMSVQAPAASSQGKLIFNKYGDEYFLSQVWKPGTNAGCELRKSRREIEVAASARRATESIMARK